MSQSDAGMIVHMHLCPAGTAAEILVPGLKGTAEPDYIPAGCRHTGGCRLIHEAVQEGRNHQKISRLSKC